jgi:hypothetical protein
VKKTKQTKEEQLQMMYDEMTPYFKPIEVSYNWKELIRELSYDSWYPIFVEEERKRKEKREKTRNRD